jgi:hypothetical protein
LTSVEKELQQANKDNAALARYINARRNKEEAWRKEEAQKKEEEEARRKAMVVARCSMRAKAPRMSGLGESSHPRMVQSLSLLLLAHIFC